MSVTAVLRRVGLVCLLASISVSASAASNWPQWDDFTRRFIQADGRIIDLTFERKSTSEGQSYGLFFSLVANRRSQFDSILKWTSDNLASGQLGDKRPGWHWGLREDGSWGLKDANSASDADLWLAYTLLEAARLWNEPRYALTGRKLLAQVARYEVAQAGRAGPVLLPAAIGFVLDKGRFRVNPSYLPEFMFRYFAAVDAKGPWQAIWDNYLRMQPKIFSVGIAPDHFVVDSQGAILPDTENTPMGSYDAIRVYLWAGMSTPANTEMLKRLTPYSTLIRSLGSPPEKVDPISGKPLKSDYSPMGFSGAVLPFLSALGDQASLEKQRDRIRSAATRTWRGASTNYYDQVLILFGSGWLEGQYRFDTQGRLQTKWVP